MPLKLPTPNSFPAFPYVSYEIQLSLMQHLYTSIEERNVTIVESPTGTGKTLSLLCSSLTWLRDEQDRARKGKLAELSDQCNGEIDWVVSQTIERKRRAIEAEERDYEERLLKARKKEAALRKMSRAKARKRVKTYPSHSDEVLDLDDTAFLPEGDEDPAGETDNISPAVRALMKRMGGQENRQEIQEAEPTCTKIYYASRTHSQLAQVLHELRKLKIHLSTTSVASFHPELTAKGSTGTAKRPISMVEEEDGDQWSPDARAVSLGSRKHLCINEKLKARAGDLDEACRQTLGEKGDRRCKFLPLAEEESRMLDFRDQILALPKDIEDLIESGQNAETCPYFGSRRAIPQAQLVMLPYNLLLQKTARDSLGIDLTNQVVIIDEAHNLISTLLSLSTARLPIRTLATSLHQLSIYLKKFRNRLSTKNSLYLRRLVSLLEALSKYAEEWKSEHFKVSEARKEANSIVEVMSSGELLARLGRDVEGINLLEIEAYLRESRIARKISGYCMKELEKAAGQDAVKQAKLRRLTNMSPPLHSVESFIITLSTASEDGRISFSILDDQLEIKYHHLNPATHFQEVVDVARSVVLAGGTMSPISDVTSQLFTSLPEGRLSTFSCGHIIPASNLQTLVLKKGPRGGDLQYKFDRRGDPNVMAELAQAILNFVNLVPGGMVAFVPSYSFLRLVVTTWEGNGMMEKLKSKKRVFLEPQESSEVDSVLREYTAEIQDPNRKPSPESSRKSGALLFAVIGAKLSEGLNFTDDLARAVIIVGLPFANMASPELRERMNYVNRQEQARGTKRPPGAKDAATELYENMCMNAVNQSIGRAIRHRADWASLVLIDARYSAPRIRNKLPNWIGQNIIVTETFGEAIREMGRFYRDKRPGA